MKATEFLTHVCNADGPSQLLAGDIIEGMSPISFAELVTDISLQNRLISSMKKASQRIIAKSKDRHPVTLEMLDEE